ncbi:MAG: ribosome silencing factor [Bacteroidaceae bacterium]|nr:ribosome silencing factor [Bacteroidaceae bacterium]
MKIENKLVQSVVAGIEEKKGEDIVVIDLDGVEGAICKFFVICSGNSPIQVDAICDSVEETVRKLCSEKPVRIAGRENSQWVAIDYTDVMVHIFLPDARRYYSLEDLWNDAEIIVEE